MKQWKELLTPTNIVLAGWLLAQGIFYGAGWVTAKDTTAQTQADRITQLEQTVKVLNEALQMQHTYSEVVNVRLANIEKTLERIEGRHP